MSNINKKIAAEILNIFQERYVDVNVPLLSYDMLNSWLNDSQQKLISYIMSLKPINYSQKEIPENDVLNSECLEPSNASEEQKIFARIPKKVDSAFIELQKACYENTGFKIFIVSGYRSKTYQALLFLREFYNNEFILENTLTKILPPAYSEHGDANNPAIDISAETISSNEFSDYIYPWLAKNAEIYGFKESYTKNNGVMIWEPWHWRLHI